MSNEERELLVAVAAHLKKHGFENVSTNATWSHNKGAPQLFFIGDSEAGDRAVALIWGIAEQHGYIVGHISRTWDYLGFVKHSPQWGIVFTRPLLQGHSAFGETVGITGQPPSQEELRSPGTNAVVE